MPHPQIITYSPVYRQNFIDLNTEWLQKYFTVEPHDQNVFDHLEDVILVPGGEIFFCLYDNKVVGTVAMERINGDTFELTKMAVTELHKGKGFSKLLMEGCISFARKKGIKKIILLSNRSLTPAITLYSKFGFKEVPLDPTDYSRANIQMELEIQ
jgi:N-acetylglutamate synthase-like GNAT family acetyltransferase